MVWGMKGVLVGVAEVKLPIKRLGEERQMQIVREVYCAVTDNYEADCDRDVRERAIGEVDGYYAMEEVSLEEKEGHCVLRRDKDIILQFRLRDVMLAKTMEHKDTQVIYITRSENFGRAAVVLQMMNSDDAAKLVQKLMATEVRVVETKPPVEESETFLDKLSSIINAVGINNKTATRPTISSPIDTRPKSVSNESSKRTSQFYDYDDSSDDDTEENDITDLNDDTSDSINLEPAPLIQKDDPQYMIEAEMKYIAETEDRYLKTLQSLEEDRDYLSKNAPSFFKKWLSQLFRQVRPITSMHEKLFLGISNAKYDILKFSESFMDLEKDFTAYIYYIENIPTVDKIVTEFSTYLKGEKPDLIDKLRLPRLRLNHYVLMLESLQKKVTAGEKIYLQDVIDLCKRSLKEADKALLLGTIKGCPFPLSECGDFVYRTDLKLVSAPDLPYKVFHIVLLDRKLLFVSGRLDDFQFVHSIPVDEMTLKTTARGLYFSIMVNKSDKGFNHTYKFKAKNIKVQQLWITKIRMVVENFRITFARNQGRASFGRSGRKIRQSFATARKFLPSLKTSVPNVNAENGSDSGTDSEVNKYWDSRRKAVRKYSSLSSKTGANKNLRTASSISETEDARHSHGMAPLTVWNFFHEIEKLYRVLRNDQNSVELLDREECSRMDEKELTYTKTLNDELRHFLESGGIDTPKDIKVNIRRLYEFHSMKIVPNYNDKSCLSESILQCLNLHAEEFAVLYSEFLSDRCSLHTTLFESNLEDHYILPVRHFILYCKCAILLRQENKLNRALINTAISVLHDTITAANNCLLADCINNVPFALSQCQPILLVNKFKVRWDIRARQEYQVILLQDRLIILEIRPPLYNYHSSLRLDSTCLGPSLDSYTFQLEYRVSAQMKKIYSFKAQNKEIRDSWMKEVIQILSDQAIKLKTEHKMRVEEAPKLLDVSASLLAVEDLHTIDISKSPNLSKKNLKPLETDL